MTSAQTFAVSASDTYPEDFRLLELTPELAAQLEALDTCTLRIAGRTTDTATLIDPQETTYSVHTAHTSNNLYLLTHAASSETNPLETLELRAKINQTLELQRVQPTVHARLREVLSWDTRGAYRGSEFDKADPGGRRVDDQALHAHVAVGPKALKKALEEVPAFRDTQGHWRTIDAGFCVELLRLLLATQVEHAWASCYDARLLHPALQADLGAPLPYEAVHAVLARFGRPIDGRPACYTIERRRVARFLAEHIFLAENMRAWPAADFAQALAATMPPQLASDGGSDDGLDAWGFAHIPRSPVRDLAYATVPTDPANALHAGSHRTLLTPLFRSLMPADARERIAMLFAAKPQWSAKEVTPFLEDLVDVDQQALERGDEAVLAQVAKAVDVWMLRFGRAVKCPSGETVYTSRIN